MNLKTNYEVCYKNGARILRTQSKTRVLKKAFETQSPIEVVRITTLNERQDISEEVPKTMEEAEEKGWY
jgi:hypothetical protein